MQPKQRALFDASKYVKRKSADQIEFETSYLEEVLTMKEIMEQAFESTMESLTTIPVHCQDKNLLAVLMSGYITGNVLEKYPQFTKKDNSGRTLFTKDNKFAVYFKKLDKNRKPQNIPTDHSEML